MMALNNLGNQPMEKSVEGLRGEKITQKSSDRLKAQGSDMEGDARQHNDFFSLLVDDIPASPDVTGKDQSFQSTKDEEENGDNTLLVEGDELADGAIPVQEIASLLLDVQGIVRATQGEGQEGEQRQEGVKQTALETGMDANNKKLSVTTSIGTYMRHFLPDNSLQEKTTPDALSRLVVNEALGQDVAFITDETTQSASFRRSETLGDKIGKGGNHSSYSATAEATNFADAIKLDNAAFNNNDTAQATGVRPEKIDIGDKLALKTITNTQPASPLSDVEIVSSKKSASLTLLHLKLHPDEFGPLEARIRTGSDGLYINLRAEREESAHLLAQDQRLLAEIIEKSGFDREARLHLVVTERTGQMLTASAANGQQGEGGKQETGFAHLPSGAHSGNGAGGNPEGEREDKSANSSLVTDNDTTLTKPSHAYSASHRLIV